MELELATLLSKGKPEVAAAIRSKCSHSEHDQLKLLLENLLSTSNEIDDEGIIDWLTWLIAGGSTPEEFQTTVRLYDKATTCGLVWTENFVAYRCRTCGISPCMSLCTECFQHGNHEGHDFIVFRSETGGACDCGEINIIKESGCCSLHGPRGTRTQSTGARSSRSDSNSSSHEQPAPSELLCIANEMMPHMFYRLLLSMRKESVEKNQNPTMPKITPTCKHNNNNNTMEVSSNLSKGHKFIKMLQGLSDMGIAMRQVMINCLTNPPVYQSLTGNDQLTSDPRSKTFLEELVYWTVKFEFPEDLIRLLLSMRSDSSYKEAFTRAFVIHYRLVSETILKSVDPEKLCKHVAAVSVQLFSIEQLAVEMVDQERLLHLLVASLYDMIHCTLVPSPEEQEPLSMVLDCDHEIMKNNYYWPIKSDLKELLSHQPVAAKFFQDEELLKQWFEFLSFFQGMNRSRFIEKGLPHVEQESEIHIGAFTAELEISATPMWTLLSHLKDKSTSAFTKEAVNHCWRKLQECTELEKGEISFHLPLHRNLSMFIHQGVQHQGLSLMELLPSAEHLTPIIRQLIRLQSTFYQILGRLWTRNGTEIVNQAESYVNSLCCNSMIDADLFLLQVTSTYNSQEEFLQILFEEFRINEILEINPNGENRSTDLEPDEQNVMLESCLLFLATLTSVRTNLGMSDESVMALEMTTLLCKGDKLHSELMELLPERCGSDSQLKNFENILSQVADYQAPRNMQQGKYVPKPRVWKALYDPIHTLLRSNNRSDFQASLDRFEEYAKRSNNYSGSQSPWPPFRIPTEETGPFPNPGSILSSGLIFEMLFIILYRAVHLRNIPNFILSLSLYLLELALSAYNSPTDLTEDKKVKHPSAIYKTNNLIENLKTEIDVSRWNEKTHTSESIISLLLKLHSQLTQGNSKSYKPASLVPPEESDMDGELYENRIGDGSFFVTKLLDKIMQKHPILYEFVLKEIKETDQSSEQHYEKEREEKRRKAKERKLQLMTEFAMKRQQFMKEVKDDLDDVDITDPMQSNISPESTDAEYECVICKEKGGSKPQNPFGLIIFITPSSVLAHRKPKDTQFSTSDKDYRNHCTIVGEELEKCVDNNSAKLTVPVDCGLGVCTQTCGHYIHFDCFTSYINSLRKARSYIMQNHSIQLTYKRFYCPLCRQIGNSFLPLIQDSLASSVSGSIPDAVDASELTRLLRKRNTLVLSPKQKQGVERFLDDLYKTVTFTRYQLSPSVPSETAQTVGSIFLYSLDMEMERTKTKSVGDIKRSCLSPLYSILRYSYKSLSAGHSRKISQLWEIICGLRSAKGQKEVPVLLSDLNLTLAHLVLQLPYGVESQFLDLIVEKICCLRLVQILYGFCIHLDREQLMEVKMKYSASPGGNSSTNNSIQFVLLKIVESLETSKALLAMPSSSVSSQMLNCAELESFVESRMNPFVRRAELLRQFILKGKLINASITPSIAMETDAIPYNFNTTAEQPIDFLRTIFHQNLETVIPLWIASIMELDTTAVNPIDLFKSHLVLWDEPKLIDVPVEYDRIFQNYRKIKCQNCNSTPSEPAVCLACGKVVCLNSFCCIDKQSKLSEVIHHSISCGMGTSVFLCVLSSAILVVVGNDACVWGSIFLDSFGEEDLDLKRGKPLFLCKERFQFLQRQWITHSFLKSELKWFPHDNML